MFYYLKSLSDRSKLLAPVALCVAALVTVGALGMSAIERVKVGGAMSDELLSNKELLSDVLPPSLYLVEMHLAVHEADGENDPTRLAEFQSKYAALRKEYDERQEHWKKTLPPGPARDLVFGPLSARANEYFAICEQQFIPALKAGQNEQVDKLVNVVLKDKYHAQRAVVDQLVSQLNAESQAKAQEAASVVTSSTRVTLALLVIVPLVAVVIAVVIVRTVTGKTTAALERAADFERQVVAMGKAQAVIEFNLDGTVRTANDTFLGVMGYTLGEVEGKHHRMFVDPAYGASNDYKDFWARLNRGEAHVGEFQRVGRNGNVVWVRGLYFPIVGADGKPYKVVKFALDITQQKHMERQVALDAERQKQQTDELRKKIESILVVVNALAAGDFTQNIPDLGTDGVGQMAAALNKAVTSVRTALEGVREVSEQLADASGQLASASEEIATGAQEQASGLEETASTLEEITATVKQNSDSAQQARQLASGSKEVAEKGGSVVGSAVEAMSEINASSKKIAEIITAIDEIAFQTNLLALNAAVEAARAGEQGRGFAVVAAEVRNLAQRSASAAKEIKALIQDSVKKVDAGTELVNKSGATLGEIVNSVKRVTDIVTEIAAASREQSTGIDQVNKAVTQMDSVTQRNASQTEEMSATAQTLTEQAGHLRDLVSRFKLGHGDVGAAHPVAAPKRAKANKPRPAMARAMGRTNGHAHELDALGNGNGNSDDGYTEF